MARIERQAAFYGGHAGPPHCVYRLETGATFVQQAVGQTGGPDWGQPGSDREESAGTEKSTDKAREQGAEQSGHDRSNLAEELG